jgi:hypothetical protein
VPNLNKLITIGYKEENLHEPGKKEQGNRALEQRRKKKTIEI